MTVTLWRVATETRDYKANDLSGAGAAKAPGRWNAVGEFVLYTAPTLAMAVLETAAHVQAGGLPLNRFVIRVDVPDDVWAARRVDVAKLDPAWQAIPAGRASVDYGSAWYKSAASLLLVLPSVIVPEESAVLINATHPDAKHLVATTVRPFDYDKLFR